MPTGDSRPNILWVCADQQRFDTIGALGNPHIQTPNIDRLVADGVAFTSAFCQSPICTPSRSSFLTGMYPSTIHACTNGNDFWAGAAPLVTRLLADSGYDCGLAGKLHLAGAADRVEPRGDDGYRVFYWSQGTGELSSCGQEYTDWVRSKGEDLGELRQHPERIPFELHQTTWCTDKALEFMQEKRDGPWLMSVNIFDPHDPFDPPQSYLDRYDSADLPEPAFRESDHEAHAKLGSVDFAHTPTNDSAKEVKAKYYAMITLVDDNVGRMLDSLERSGQRDNTIVIFTSDHGEMLGDHGLVGKGCRFYEGLVRVPLIFSWPGQFKENLRSDALVELMDITPTLLDVAGLPLPERIQGRSLAGILGGAGDPHTHRDTVRCEYFRVLNPDVPGRGDFSGTYATMVRDRRYKLAVYHDRDVGELFDLQSDPEEFDNLWDDSRYREVRFDLMKRSFDALALAVDIGPKQVTRY